MSEHVVHMAKGRDSKEAYDNIIGILGSQKIEARKPFGIARYLALDSSSQRAACFSEIPLERLDRLAARRIPGYPDGWHGIGFSKAIVIERGGGPVFYVYAGTPHAVAVRELIERAKTSQISNDPIWRLTPMIETPGVYNDREYYFEWEREWRHVGDFAFDTIDVAFLIMPETLHAVAREFFADAYAQNTGPAYFCPFLDITWPRDRILCALASGSVAAPALL
jgi:abortive phage resistance protein AbiGi (putative antitoxin)